jgi:hypothetical protein
MIDLILLAADMPVSNTMPWIDIAREIGVLAALAGFFTWQSWRREERLANRVTDLEKFIEEKLLEVIEKSMVHIAENTNNLRTVSEHMNVFMEKLGTRPCLYEDMIHTLKEQGYDIVKKSEIKEEK